MCGVVGLFRLSSLSSRLGLGETVGSMAQAIQHRGPDDQGVWADDDQGIALGHRRLSIVDLSPAGHQPMSCHHGRYVLSFNGEIYNHDALRSELESLNLAPAWRGHSDTETLLAAFNAWGFLETLQRAVGMFVIALWDKKERCLRLARDRMGEKPLYYGWVCGAFVFGSELKALRAYPGFDNPISRDTLGLYVQHSVVPAPYSIYHNIFKLEPGCWLSVNQANISDRQVLSQSYWRVTDVAGAGLAHPIEHEATALSQLEATLRDAVSLQTVADVPLGAFLSGGVDSSTVVALMQSQSSRPIQTFTIGFDEVAFDESSYATAVANHLKTDHHVLCVTASDAQRVIPMLPHIYDEPFADSSQIPTYLVSNMARSSVTVALSGDGGDELFGGYNRYVLGPRIWKYLSAMPYVIRRGLGVGFQTIPVARWNQLASLSAKMQLPYHYHFGQKVHKIAQRLKTVLSLDDLYRSLVIEWPEGLSVVQEAISLSSSLHNNALVSGVRDAEHRMMLWDTLTYLPDDILTKVDRAAMAVSLETRVPLLDHRVVELAWQLPLSMKIRNNQGKWALRQILYQYIPKELIERPKMGFGIPVGLWLRESLRDWAEDLLSEQRLKQEGYFNPQTIRTMWRDHLKGHVDWTARLWTVLMFQAWLETVA